MAMRASRAIFTSAQTSRLQGYHVVARSQSIDDAMERQLTHWSPTHAGLVSDDWTTTSLQCFPLDDQFVGFGRSIQGSSEYSSRGSLAVFTQLMVVSEQSLNGYDQNPLAFLRTALLMGYLRFEPDHPTVLPDAELPDRSLLQPIAMDTQVDRAENFIESIVAQLRDDQRVAVLGAENPLEILALVLRTIPASVRARVSFATGIRYSVNRPFHLQFFPNDEATFRQLQSEDIVCLRLG